MLQTIHSTATWEVPNQEVLPLDAIPDGQQTMQYYMARSFRR